MPLKRGDTKKLAEYLETGCDALSSAKRLLADRKVTWQQVINEIVDYLEEFPVAEPVVVHHTPKQPTLTLIPNELSIAEQVERMMPHIHKLPEYERNWLLQKQGYCGVLTEKQQLTFNGIKRLLEAQMAS